MTLSKSQVQITWCLDTHISCARLERMGAKMVQEIGIVKTIIFLAQTLMDILCIRNRTCCRIRFQNLIPFVDQICICSPAEKKTPYSWFHGPVIIYMPLRWVLGEKPNHFKVRAYVFPFIVPPLIAVRTFLLNPSLLDRKSSAASLLRGSDAFGSRKRN